MVMGTRISKEQAQRDLVITFTLQPFPSSLPSPRLPFLFPSPFPSSSPCLFIIFPLLSSSSTFLPFPPFPYLPLPLYPSPTASALPLFPLLPFPSSLPPSPTFASAHTHSHSEPGIPLWPIINERFFSLNSFNFISSRLLL